MLPLQSQKARVANVNPRAEKHGDENVLAVDLKLEFNAHSSVLDVFDDKLRGLLFCMPRPGEQQSLSLGDDDRTALRCPKLAPLKWDEDFPGFGLTIRPGMGLREDLELDDVELSGFTFEPIEGGSVKVTVRATCHPDGDQTGELCELIQEEVEITLTPPEREEPRLSIDMSAAEPRGVLVTSIEVTLNTGTHLLDVVATLSDGEEVSAGDWAARPTIDQVAGAIYDRLQKPVEFTSAAREEYTVEEAA